MSDQHRDDAAITSWLENLGDEPRFRGSVDLLDGEFLQGWCISCTSLADPVWLDVFLGSCHIGAVLASDNREDISTAIAYPVRAGFRFHLADCPESAAAEAIAEVRRARASDHATLLSARVRGSHLRLPYSPSFSFGEVEIARVLAILERRTTRPDGPKADVSAPPPGQPASHGHGAHGSGTLSSRDSSIRARRRRPPAPRTTPPGGSGEQRPSQMSAGMPALTATQGPGQRSGSVSQQAVANEIRQRINESAPLDSLLQELARLELMIHELTTDMNHLAAEVRAARAQRLVRDVLLPQVSSQYRGFDSARVDAGMPLDDTSGFYPLEYDHLGHPFRWTGPHHTFHFDLHLDRSVPLRFWLSLSASDGEDPAATRAFSDGVELPCEVVDLGDRIELGGVLMPREAGGLTRLYFRPCSMAEAVAPEPGGEDRLLGVVFRELRIEPIAEDELHRWLEYLQAPAAFREGGATASTAPPPMPLPDDVAGPDIVEGEWAELRHAPGDNGFAAGPTPSVASRHVDDHPRRIR